MKAIIFDIDGTLADLSHRLHHVQGGKKDWPAFFGAMADDTVIEPVADHLRLCADRYPIILCSGRPEDYRAVTEKWLADSAIEYSALYMRAAGDYRPDDVVKSQLLDGILADGYEPILVVDDRPRVISMWRRRGLTCFQCREWVDDDAPLPKSGRLTLMVGPSGAGKSYWLASDQAAAFGITPAQIVSSDAIRTELCGNFLDQSRNDQVFSALHAVVKARIEHGLDTVVDATNLRRKDRLAVVSLAPAGSQIRYVVIDRSLSEKRRDGGWRTTLPIDLISKHAQTFGSQIKDILAGDGLANVEVIDLRVKCEAAA